jgi:hypothetical protein
LSCLFICCRLCWSGGHLMLSFSLILLVSFSTTDDIWNSDVFSRGCLLGCFSFDKPLCKLTTNHQGVMIVSEHERNESGWFLKHPELLLLLNSCDRDQETWFWLSQTWVEWVKRIVCWKWKGFFFLNPLNYEKLESPFGYIVQTCDNLTAVFISLMNFSQERHPLCFMETWHHDRYLKSYGIF